MASITISEARGHLGESVTLKGWLYNKRSSGKILFLQLRDGTGVLQGVLAESDNSQLLALAARLPRETSVVATGILREDRRAPSGC
jgi:asparaginyl-tRNA synthetase